MTQKIDIESFLSRQLREWPLLASNHALLSEAPKEKVSKGDSPVITKTLLNFRRQSLTADLDKIARGERRCFLCEEARPTEQNILNWERYQILANPYPVAPHHLTIVNHEHTPQSILGRAGDMVRLAFLLPDYCIFYNGPKCGASAPDHMHFQAVDIELAQNMPHYFKSYTLDIAEADADMADEMVTKVLSSLPNDDPNREPMVNIIAYRLDNQKARIVIIPRRRHRPSCYGSEEGKILVSPASVEMMGHFITSREEDFKNLNLKAIKHIYEEVAYPSDKTIEEPRLNVGILSAKEVKFCLAGQFYCRELGGITGDHCVNMQTSGLTFQFNNQPYTSLTFVPTSPDDCHFEIDNVKIGIDFHWERNERQFFKGSLTLKVIDGMISVINAVPMETYLTAVISSEMNATSPLPFLQAHAVISRSWAIKQIKPQRDNSHEHINTDISQSGINSIIRWWDHEDHKDFDVCADDHCQRYQGFGRTNQAAIEAVAATSGLVLMSEGGICDTRFSKCCGGMMETFESCWSNGIPHPYLQGRRDNATSETYPDLSIEHSAREWIESTPDSFCGNVTDDTLRRVLNGYDRELKDFYRWDEHLTQAEIVSLLKNRSDIELGEILDLIPVDRGASGRIVRLRIVGTQGEIVIGKELMIRRSLSPSHLLSSAFTVEKHYENGSGIPSAFTLHGAGWGHGVGLCQIGAAVMAEQGYGFEEILSHYYPGSSLVKLY